MFFRAKVRGKRAQWLRVWGRVRFLPDLCGKVDVVFLYFLFSCFSQRYCVFGFFGVTLCIIFMYMRLLFSLILSGVACAGMAQVSDVRWHNEANDTTCISEMLTDASEIKFANPSARTAWFGRQFEGRPYVAHTLEGEREVVTVNLDELDCTTFVETALALSYTAGEGRMGWQDYVYNLRRMRYRGGEVDGYASRLHYNCDWAMDNVHRGNIVDVTPNIPKCKYMIRTIDYMTEHRDSYAALKDSTEFARIKQIENGYRNHRFPYIKTVDLASKDVVKYLREGDVLAFVSNLKDLDVTHMGMVVIDNGTPRVMHASMSNGKVEIAKGSLHDFVKRNRGWIGVRVYRLTE